MRRSLIVLAIVTAGVSARADPPRTSSLTWTRATGAEDCIGALDLARAVEERLGRPVFVNASSAQLTIDGRVERRATSQGWRAVVTLRSAKGEDLGVRELSSDEASCSALDEPVALTIALMIDPAASLAPSPARPAVPPASAPPSPAPPPPPSTAQPPREAPPPQPSLGSASPGPTRLPWRLAVVAGPLFELGLLPNPGFGFGASVFVTPPRLITMELYAARWLTNDAELRPGAGASLSVTYVGLAACPASLRSRRAAALVCAGVEVGDANAQGYGFTFNEGDAATLIDAALRGSATFRPLGPLTLGAALELGVPFNRGPFYYRDALGEPQEVFRIAPVDGVAAVMIGLTTP